MVNSAQCMRGWPGRFLCSLRYACAVWKVDTCSRESACLKKYGLSMRYGTKLHVGTVKVTWMRIHRRAGKGIHWRTQSVRALAPCGKRSSSPGRGRWRRTLLRRRALQADGRTVRRDRGKMFHPSLAGAALEHVDVASSTLM